MNRLPSLLLFPFTMALSAFAFSLLTHIHRRYSLYLSQRVEDLLSCFPTEDGSLFLRAAHLHRPGFSFPELASLYSALV